jgi:hypothetical protein
MYPSDAPPEERIYRIEFWPGVVHRRPAWLSDIASVDGQLFSLLEETYQALNSGLKVITAIGMRTSIDRATEVLKIDPSLTFEEKLEALEKLGRISAEEKKSLRTLIDAGSAAAHRGWSPSDVALNTMVAITENFLHQTFILDQKWKELSSVVPPKPPRTKKTP